MSSEISEESIRKLLEKTIKPKLSNRYYDILLMFLNWLASLGLRPSTRYRYAEVVASFLKWLQEREIDPYNFKLLDIEEYFTEIRKNWKNRNWWEDRFIHYVIENYYKKKPNRGIYVMGEDWDNLIILDACRYDMFESFRRT